MGKRFTRRISRDMAAAQKKGTMPGQAIRNVAEPRQVGEQFLLEQRRQRVIEVGGLSLQPKAFHDFRRVSRRKKERRANAHPLADIVLDAINIGDVRAGTTHENTHALIALLDDRLYVHGVTFYRCLGKKGSL